MGRVHVYGPVAVRPRFSVPKQAGVRTREMTDTRTAWNDLDGHLADWGLRRFTGDDAYFRWQRQTLSADDLAALHAHVEKKREGTSE